MMIHSFELCNLKLVLVNFTMIQGHMIARKQNLCVNYHMKFSVDSEMECGMLLRLVGLIFILSFPINIHQRKPSRCDICFRKKVY